MQTSGSKYRPRTESVLAIKIKSSLKGNKKRKKGKQYVYYSQYEPSSSHRIIPRQFNETFPQENKSRRFIIFAVIWTFLFFFFLATFHWSPFFFSLYIQGSYVNIWVFTSQWFACAAFPFIWNLFYFSTNGRVRFSFSFYFFLWLQFFHWRSNVLFHCCTGLLLPLLDSYLFLLLLYHFISLWLYFSLTSLELVVFILHKFPFYFAFIAFSLSNFLEVNSNKTVLVTSLHSHIS